MIGAHALFWASVGLLFYTYAGYPALLWGWAKLRRRPHRAARAEPDLTILVVAHNEAARIEARLENLLALDYPRERREILLASDGSTDGTVERAKGFCKRGVRVVAFGTRRGKPAVLNDLVPEAWGKIVLLADARQRFDPGALRALVDDFADPGVGAVSGELILTPGEDTSGVGQGVGFYWKYEKFIRRHESFVDSTVGATGAIYAIRRELYEPLPEDTLVDDLQIPMRIVRRGYRVLFEPGARAYDRVSATAGMEFTRKVRTIAGNFQLFLREPWLLNPLANRIWLQTLSHKACRLFGPLGLVAAFGSNLMLLDEPFFRWTLALQLIFYLAAACGSKVRDTARSHFLLNVPYALCLLNWAAVVAFVRVLFGRQQVTWEKGSG